jgi:hypothetical protein
VVLTLEDKEHVVLTTKISQPIQPIVEPINLEKP